MNYYTDIIFFIKSKVKAENGDIKNKTQVINILKNYITANKLIEFYKTNYFYFLK